MHPVTGGSYWVDPQSLGHVKRAVIISARNNWILAMALVLIVLFWEKRPLTSIGLRMPRSGDVPPALGALVAFYLIGFTGNSLGSVSNPKAFPIFYALPWIVRLWMLSVLVCEEIMFRGYFIERVEQLTGRTWIAAALSCILFGLAHASGWGFGYIFVVAAVGASYATLYVRRRNLPACMIIHFVTDMPLLWLPLSPIFWLSLLL
jgi:membrane protease YdiL (CAAX protease family)